jgi:peptidoglycan/LPS O-acetylase OafA/YrhL
MTTAPVLFMERQTPRRVSGPLAGSTNGEPAPRSHVPALDGLRGLAILLVMTYHFTGGTDATASGVNAWFSRITGIGWCGVDLFFVLSGFLITGILYDTRRSGTYLRDFYARRSLRIFPLYYGVLLVLFVLLPLVPSLPVPGLAEVSANQGWLWSYCCNFAIFFRGDSLFASGLIRTSHFWSLAVEEQFYIVWPLVVLCLRRGALLKCCVAGIAAASLLRIGLVAGGVGSVYTFTPCRLDGLLVGAFLALVSRSDGGLGTLVPAAKRTALGAGALLAATWAVTGLDSAHWTMQTAGFTLLAGFFGSLLVLVLAGPGRGRWRWLVEGRTLRFFGKYSYGLYVWHFLLGPTFMRFFSVEILVSHVFGHYWPARLTSMALSFAVSITAAWLSWHLWEKHFLKLKGRFDPRLPSRAHTRPRGAAPGEPMALGREGLSA